MRITLIFSLLLFSSLKINAQTAATSKTVPGKSIIAYFNYDSLLVLIPGYKETADSVKTYKEIKTQEIIADKKMVVLKSRELDSLGKLMSPFQKQVRQKDIDEQKKRIAQSEEDLKTIDAEKFNPYELKLTEAAKKIALTKGYATVADSKNAGDFILWAGPGIKFVNMTSDICSELGIKK